MSQIAPRRLRLLVVDDVDTNVELLRIALQDEYEIDDAGSGEEAIRRAEAFPPDLILLDVRMPGMDGYETLSRLRAKAPLARIPVIFVSGLEDADSEAKGLALGADDYVVKSLDTSLTRQRVRNVLERNRARTRLELALASANAGLWEWDIARGLVSFDPEWAAPLGYAPGEMKQNQLPWDRIVHPQDMPSLLTAIDEHFRGVREAIALDLRLRNRDDYWTWVQLFGKIVAVDGQGQPTQLAGTYLDIARRKKAEEGLRERESRLETLVASLQDAVVVLDTSGRVVRHHLPNDACFPPADDPAWRGNYHDVMPRQMAQETDQAIEHVILEAQPAHFECSAKDADNHERYFRITVSALADSKDLPTGFLIVIRDVTDLKEAEQEIRKLALFDVLTQLPNRRLLMDRLRAATVDSQRRESTGALFFIDLDNFKTLNDSHGHEKGDQLLVEAAQRLQRCVREGDTVARLGGDEFVVVLGDFSPEPARAHRDALAVAEKILQALGSVYALGPVSHVCTSSIGIKLFHGTAESPETILANADAAMYQAKMAGKNMVCCWERPESV